VIDFSHFLVPAKEKAPEEEEKTKSRILETFKNKYGDDQDE
jgi:hypothetical protein